MYRVAIIRRINSGVYSGLTAAGINTPIEDKQWKIPIYLSPH